MDPIRHLKVSMAVLLLLVSLGTVGYMGIERWRLLDALYMTVITFSTVGYGEVRPLSPAGRMFTIGLILVGVGAALYLLTELVRFVYEGQLGSAIWRRRMDRRSRSLRSISRPSRWSTA